MPVHTRSTLFLIACGLAFIGCGGREEEWSRKAAPVADSGEGVRVVLRELHQESDRIDLHVAVENDGDAPVAFPLQIHKTPILPSESADSPSHLTVDGQKITWCMITTKNVSRYNFAARVGTLSAMAESFDGTVSVGAKGKQTFVLAFFPQPETSSGSAPFAFTIDGIERGGQKLKPLVLDIK